MACEDEAALDRPPPVPPDPGPPGPPAVPEYPSPPSKRIGLFAAAIAAVAVGAVGATLLVRSATHEDQGKIDPGWQKVSVGAEGFSVGIPPGWKSVSTTSADQAFEALKAANPQLANLVKDQLGESLSSLIKLLAFDTNSPTLEEKFATNMNVVVAPAPGVDINTFLEQNLAALRKTPGLANVEYKNLRLPAGPGALVTSQLTLNAPGGAQQVAITQYLLVNGAKGYIMSFSTLPSFVHNYEADFRKIAETFRLVSG